MTNAISVYYPNLPLGGLEAYIARASEIPLLSAEEEYQLASDLQQHADLNAAQKLVLSHLRYVIRVAKGYLGYGLPLADLIQEGAVGLMKAVRRFDPTQGVRLVSFAVHWIKAEIHEFILKNWRIVKIATTKAQRKLFFNLRSAKKRLGWFSRDEVLAVAADLGVKPTDVLRMEERLNARDTTFDSPNELEGTSHSKHSLVPSEYLEAPNADPAIALENNNWETHTGDTLQLAFQKLDDRSQDIIQQRWLVANDGEQPKAKLKELALKYKVSTERIRQLEEAAMKKLKKWIEEEDIAVA